MTVPSSTALRTTFAVTAILIGSVFWGLNGPVTKVLYRDAHFDALGMIAARGCWSLPIFLAMAYIGRPDRRPGAADCWRLVILGLIYGPITAFFIALGAQYTSGAHISLLSSLIPPLTAVLGAIIFRERANAIRVLALAIGLAGAVLLASTRSATNSSLIGDIYVLIQVVGIAVALMLTRSLARRYNPFFLSGSFGAIAMASIAAIGIAGGGGHTVVAVLGDLTTALWFFIVIVLGLSVYTQLAQAWALRVLGAGSSALISSYGSLMVGIGASLWLLHEQLTATGIVAGILIALGLGLALVPVGTKQTES